MLREVYFFEGCVSDQPVRFVLHGHMRRNIVCREELSKKKFAKGDKLFWQPYRSIINVRSLASIIQSLAIGTHYKEYKSMSCKPTIFLKSEVLRERSTRLSTIAVAAIMASGSLSL
jgi:hypothetical protein